MRTSGAAGASGGAPTTGSTTTSSQGRHRPAHGSRRAWFVAGFSVARGMLVSFRPAARIPTG